MSKETTYESRSGAVPCGAGDLYAFLTDVRNLGTVIPKGSVTDWQADEKSCSFRVENAGTVTASVAVAMPYSRIEYLVRTFITGEVTLIVDIDPVDANRSKITISASVHLNPFVKMAVGDAAGKYLDIIITAIEKYDGYDRIRGYTQSP